MNKDREQARRRRQRKLELEKEEATKKVTRWEGKVAAARNGLKRAQEWLDALNAEEVNGGEAD